MDPVLEELIRAAVPEGLRLERTECACPEDVAYCRGTPGQLIGSDIDALRGLLGEDALLDALQASRGARVEHGERSWRVPTIRPRMRDGRCVFLGDDERCRVHAVAPFGCACFDAHMDPAESDARAWWGVAQIVSDERYLALHARLEQRHGVVDPLG